MAKVRLNDEESRRLQGACRMMAALHEPGLTALKNQGADRSEGGLPNPKYLAEIANQKFWERLAENLATQTGVKFDG